MSQQESFAQLFEQSIANKYIKPGDILSGRVLRIEPDFVVIDVGLKSEGVIPKDQFLTESGDLEVNEGDDVDVALDAIEDGFGETRLSREKARRAQIWTQLARAYEASETVTGIISGKVKGGFTVDINGSIRAFLPGSLVDVRPVRDPSGLEGKELEFKVIKLDKKRNNVVVSRRSLSDGDNDGERSELLKNLQEGQEIKGIVKNLTDYGAFVDLGGIDGLLHITDMAWKRVKHPSEIVQVGDEINVKVLKYDRDRTRVSLGLKQLGDDPWLKIKVRYPEQSRLIGRVTNITDYGCFVELEEGVEGLVHVSEMDWTNKNIHPSKVVELDQEVEVMILEIDEERRRISLGLKQCIDNPWESFASKFNKNDTVSGKIKSITDFGIFVGLEGGIDGLVHLSDISWHETGEEAVRSYKKGQEVEAMVLSVDSDRERVSLGVKQLERDPFSEFANSHEKYDIVTGEVIEVDEKSATLNLTEGVQGILRAAEVAADKTDDVSAVYSVGDSVETKIINIDKKNRQIMVSVKSLSEDTSAEQKRLQAKQKSEAKAKPVSATLGDLFKEQMSKKK